jgi:hemoglobin-like flavoprotein
VRSLLFSREEMPSLSVGSICSYQLIVLNGCQTERRWPLLCVIGRGRLVNEGMSLKVNVLAESFDLIVLQKEAFAEAFYNRLFFLYPQTSVLFKDTDMKRQQDSLVAALALVISSLKNSNTDQLVSVLRDLGQRHVGYGVEPEHYPLVGEVLLKTFADFLGNKWTTELNDAWADAYSAIVGLMVPNPETAQA